MVAERLPIAVSMGDPAGIGPDVILKAWQQFGPNNLPSFFVVGCSKTLKDRATLMGLEINTAHPGATANTELPVHELQKTPRGIPAKPDVQDAEAAIEAIDTSFKMVADGTASALVTCPINKKSLYGSGFKHPGHTEYLEMLANSKYGGDHKAVMMIAGPELRTVPVTIHIPLSDAPAALSKTLIVKTGQTVAQDLSHRFRIDNPKIAFSGLNPHAGEDGALGTEEQEIIEPAVAELRRAGINAIGPLPADTMFHKTAREKYDVAVCMYHDQALVPAKMLGFDDGVNVTLGLPFVRTSPDHGTAYDIAGTGKANPSSFVAALRMAEKMVAA